MLGTQTLSSMRQFTEEAEKEKGQKKNAQREGIKALRKLLKDLEAQIKWQDEADEESSSDFQDELFVAMKTRQLTSILSPQEYEDALSPTKEQNSSIYVRTGSNQ